MTPSKVHDDVAGGVLTASHGVLGTAVSDWSDGRNHVPVPPTGRAGHFLRPVATPHRSWTLSRACFGGTVAYVSYITSNVSDNKSHN